MTFPDIILEEKMTIKKEDLTDQKQLERFRSPPEWAAEVMVMVCGLHR